MATIESSIAVKPVLKSTCLVVESLLAFKISKSFGMEFETSTVTTTLVSIVAEASNWLRLLGASSNFTVSVITTVSAFLKPYLIFIGWTISRCVKQANKGKREHQRGH